MPQDPTQPIRKRASQFAGVDEGTACTQSSFKVGKKAFLFIGEQGGRYKAMFKLDESIGQATRLAKANPDDFQVGNTAWVTARFSDEKPMPKKLWEKWLDESYGISASSIKPAKKKAAKLKSAASPAKLTKRKPRKSK